MACKMAAEKSGTEVKTDQILFSKIASWIAVDLLFANAFFFLKEMYVLKKNSNTFSYLFQHTINFDLMFLCVSLSIL